MLYETAAGQEKNFSHQCDTGKGKAHSPESIKVFLLFLRIPEEEQAVSQSFRQQRTS